jgi:hypothetical protein
MRKIFFLSLLLLGCVSLSSGGVLVYSTYLGGTDYDHGYGIAVDAAGNAYITGDTWSTDFPTTTSANDTTYNGGTHDVFVSKLNAEGTTLVYSTYLGGSDDDEGYGIAVDAAGNAYITGYTSSSTDFPTTPDAWDTSGNGSDDVFVSKLNPNGTGLVYSTYLGGNGGELGNGIAVDGSGNAYITGEANSVNFPTTAGAFDTCHNVSWGGFVSKLNPSGTGLVYSTYLGGYTQTFANSIAVDGSGNAYITGEVAGGGYFPTTPGAFDNSFSGGNWDGFVSKLNPSGTGLVYSTYFGGNSSDCGLGIVLDGSRNAYITGYTSSSDFPTTPGAWDRDTSFIYGAYDVFVSKLNPSGTSLVYSTYLGGSDFDFGNGIAVDGSGNAYITGETNSIDFPTTVGAWDTINDGYYREAFVSKLNPNGTGLVYSTYFGGSDNDYGYGIAVDGSGNVYITGETGSPDFPTTVGAFDTSYNGYYPDADDAFVTKLSLGSPYLSSYGEFTTSSDTSHWYYEKYGDGTAAGTLSWVTGYNGQSGVLKLRQNAGEKGKITQIFSVASAGWYTAVAKVASDISNISKQQKIYLYLQGLNSDTTIVATGNLVVQPGNSGLIGSGVWRQLQISFYTQQTLLGVQVVGINPTTSNATGSVYLDDVWVYAGAAEPSEPIILTNLSFDEGTTGWLVQVYADGTSPGIWSGIGSWSGHTGVVEGNQIGGEKGKLSQIFSIAESGNNMTGSVWVYSAATSMGNSQKVYLYLYSYTSDYSKVIESGNAILQPGKWIPGEWHQLRFGYIPFSIYNAVQVVGINPVGKPTQSLYFDDIVINQD